jgi:hypothetical protein
MRLRGWDGGCFHLCYDLRAYRYLYVCMCVRIAIWFGSSYRLEIATMFKIRDWERYKYLSDSEHSQVCCLDFPLHLRSHN